MVTDGDSGFSVDFATPNAAVCVVFPESAFDANACKGIDPTPTRQALAKMSTAQKAPIAVARIRHDDFAYDAMVLRQSFARASTMTAERVDTWVKQTQQAVKDVLHRDVTATGVNGEPFAPAVLHDMNVLPIALTPAGDDAPPVRVLAWSFIGKDRIVTASFTTDAAHLDVVRKDAESIVGTVTWPEAKSARQSAPFAQSATKPTPTWLQVAIVLAAIAGIVFLARRLRPAKRSVASKTNGA